MRRLELIWGRMIGYMAIVTVLVVVFGGISLLYLWRTVGEHDRRHRGSGRARPRRKTGTRDYTQLIEQADQLRSRMTARVPVKGSLSFLDSRGTPHAMGIDVGQEQSMREPRSHIEGATPATAIWSYGIVPDPFQPAGRPILLDRRIPVGDFLPPGTIEGLLNRSFELQVADRRRRAREEPAQHPVQPDLASSTRASRATARSSTGSRPSTRPSKKQADDLDAQATAAETAGQPTEAAEPARAGARLHSDPIIVEMTFNVYRTTKGEVGEPVLRRDPGRPIPHTGADYVNIFPIRSTTPTSK